MDRSWNAVAAIATDQSRQLEFGDVLAGPLRDDEVLVAVKATGVCHTDIVARGGVLGVPKPIILGHEGAGIIQAVGSSVRAFAPGDRVVMSYLACGECRECRGGVPASCARLPEHCFSGARPDGTHAVLHKEGGPLHDRFFGQSAFATLAVANERNVFPIPDALPFELAAPLGCGVMTGAGAVWNELEVQPGASVAVFGVGAVGLAAVMAATAAGAARIVAVDRLPVRIALALELGATDVVDASQPASGGVTPLVDHAIDTTGNAEVIGQAFASLGQRGKLALIAPPPPHQALNVSAAGLILGSRRVMGVIEGGGSAGVTIARIIDLHGEGRFPLERIVSCYDFASINQAMHDAERGEVVKAVVRMP